MNTNIKKIELCNFSNEKNEVVKDFLKNQNRIILEIYNKNKLIHQKNILNSNDIINLVLSEINNFIKLNNYNIVKRNLDFKLNENILELSIPMDEDKNSIKAYIYDKDNLKRQLKEYINENKMNKVQEEIILSEFDDNNPYLKNKKDIMEQISELIIYQINKNELSELISNKDISITDVIDTDLSDEIKKIVIDSLDKDLQSFNNLIKIVKTEESYNLYVCDYLAKKIKYKIQLVID